MFADRLRGLLLGIILAVAGVCESAPTGSQVSKDGSTTPSTALVVYDPAIALQNAHKHAADNATAANEEGTTTTTTPKTATNGTVANNTATNGTAAPGAAGPKVHNGDAVLHYGSGDTVEKKPQHPTYFFSSWITWREDNYLMSILIPIACGVAAAVLILCSLACIGCCRRRCRSRNRRKLHRKIDPKTFRKMKAADRIKLLAASSDEEF